MMNQNNKSMKTMLSATVRKISKAICEKDEYRSWCYTGSMSSIAPGMRTW